MANISKHLFYKTVSTCGCKELMHPWTKNCAGAIFDMAVGAAKGSTRFFLLIYLLQILAKGRKISTNFLKNQLFLFPKSVMYGVSLGTGWIFTSCALRLLLRKYYYYTLVFLPACVGGLALCIENPHMQKLDAIIFFNMVLELFIRWSTGEGKLYRSKFTDTLFFMFCNALLMYLLRNNAHSRKITTIWFYSPPIKKDAKNITNENLHGISTPNFNEIHVWKNTLKEGMTYFGAAYAVQTFRSLTSKMEILFINPKYIIDILLNKRSIIFGTFFGSYVTIYKTVCHLLNKMEIGKEDTRCLAAGFLAGLSFYIKPSLTFPIMAVTTILQIFWEIFRERKTIPNWPFRQSLFCLCTGILFHCSTTMPDYAPIYIQNIMEGCTSGVSGKVIRSFHKTYSGQ